MFAVALLGMVACGLEIVDKKPVTEVENFDVAMTQESTYGFENEVFEFEYFYNEEYAYWGGFALSNV